MDTTTIYVPTRITSAEQAEALPVGTIAKHETPAGPGAWYSPPLIKTGHARWVGDDLYQDQDIIGWTALVPVEVEVEHLRETEGRRRAKNLYVTPWQEPAG